jgi:hypothetical protein
MRQPLARMLFSAAVGTAAAIFVSPVFAKTIAECDADYAANKIVIKLSGGTQEAFMAACRAGSTAPVTASTSAPDVTGAIAPAGGESAKRCSAEYWAHRKIIKARHESKKDFVAACRAGTETIPDDAAPASPAANASVGAASKEIDNSITVGSGKPAKLDFYYSLNPDCSSRGYADVTVNDSPQNGELAAKKGHDHPKFPRDSKFAKCNARFVPTTQLYYQSARGYVGDDALSVEITEPTGDKAEAIFNIKVK